MQRVAVYKAIVYTTLLAGLEAEVVVKTEIREMERMHMNLLRKVIGQWGSVETEEHGRRLKSNGEVRQLAKCVTVESELKYRKMKWLQKIVWEREENMQLRTVLIGRFAWERRLNRSLICCDFLLEWIQIVEEVICRSKTEGDER